MHERLRRALPPGTGLRFAQARHLAAIQDGSDGVLIGATGSGKSVNMFVHAAADFKDAVAAGDTPPCESLNASMAQRLLYAQRWVPRRTILPSLVQGIGL